MRCDFQEREGITNKTSFLQHPKQFHLLHYNFARHCIDIRMHLFRSRESMSAQQQK